jgi:hypothetical protein
MGAGWEVLALTIIANIMLAKSMVIVFVNRIEGPFIEGEELSYFGRWSQVGLSSERMPLIEVQYKNLF